MSTVAPIVPSLSSVCNTKHQRLIWMCEWGLPIILECRRLPLIPCNHASPIVVSLLNAFLPLATR